MAIIPIDHVFAAFEAMDEYIESGEATPADIVTIAINRANLAIYYDMYERVKAIEKNLEYIHYSMTRMASRRV